MDESRSPERRPAGGAERPAAHRGPLGILLALRGTERVAALAALTCAVSLALPWYRVRIGEGISQSGLGTFGFAEAALLVTVGSALALVLRVASGRRPPLPMHEGTLLAVAGAWAAFIVGYLMLDRPRQTEIDFPAGFGLAYGIFVAMGAAIVLMLAGLRIRRDEGAGDAAASGPGAGDAAASGPGAGGAAASGPGAGDAAASGPGAGARSPSAPSPPRSRR
ncbi:MAG: hypothetical protein U0R52_11430 [Solirubrobacterales bacterium]